MMSVRARTRGDRRMRAAWAVALLAALMTALLPAPAANAAFGRQ